MSGRQPVPGTFSPPVLSVYLVHGLRVCTGQSLPQDGLPAPLCAVESHTRPGSHATRVSHFSLGLSLPWELCGALLYHFSSAPPGSPPITSYSFPISLFLRFLPFLRRLFSDAQCSRTSLFAVFRAPTGP